MQLGFVSAILPDLSLEEVLRVRRRRGVRLRRADVLAARRRPTAGTPASPTSTSPPAPATTPSTSATWCGMHGVAVSGLGYYPNPLDPDPEHRRVVAEHLQEGDPGAPPLLGVGVVNTFIGRDPRKSRRGELAGARAGLAGDRGGGGGGRREDRPSRHCPMLFSRRRVAGRQEPGRQRRRVWRRAVRPPSRTPARAELRPVAPGLAVHRLRPGGPGVRPADRPRPRQGRADRPGPAVRGRACSAWAGTTRSCRAWATWTGARSSPALTDAGYAGPVCIEVEDRAYEGSLADRKRALRQSKRFLEQYVG